MLNKAALFYRVKTNQSYFEILSQFKLSFLFEYILKWHYSCDGKAEFYLFMFSFSFR